MRTPHMVIAALTCAALAPTGLAQGVPNGQAFGAWSVACQALGQNDTSCVLTQTLNRDTDGAFIAQILAFWARSGSPAYIAARVPEGAYLPTGFILQGEATAEPIPLVWQNCSSGVCEAMREIEEGLLDKLAGENETVLGRFQPRLDMDPVVFRFSMTGIEDGLDALRPVQ